MFSRMCFGRCYHVFIKRTVDLCKFPWEFQTRMDLGNTFGCTLAYWDRGQIWSVGQRKAAFLNALPSFQKRKCRQQHSTIVVQLPSPDPFNTPRLPVQLDWKGSPYIHRRVGLLWLGMHWLSLECGLRIAEQR